MLYAHKIIPEIILLHSLSFNIDGNSYRIHLDWCISSALFEKYLDPLYFILINKKKSLKNNYIIYKFNFCKLINIKLEIINNK